MGNMINENCHLSSKVEIMVSICLIAVLGISAVSAAFFRLFGWVYNIPKEIDIEFLRYPISRTLTIRNPLS